MVLGKRRLVGRLARAPLSPGALQVRLGVVAALDFTSSPQTASVYVSGETSATPGIRIASSYKIRIGDTVALIKSGGDLWVLSAFATFDTIESSCAVGDYLVDERPTIQAEMNALGDRGGGVLVLRRGVYKLAGASLEPVRGVILDGEGVYATHLKLADAAGDVGVFGNHDFAALSLAGNPDGPYQWGLRNLSIDGNKLGNLGNTEELVKVWGYDYTVEHVRIKDGAGGGWYSAWSGSSAAPGPDSMESRVHDLVSHDNEGDGIAWHGPHDSKWLEVIAESNGQRGVVVAPDGGALSMVDCHSWGLSQTIAFELAAQVKAINCTAEGASVVNAVFSANDSVWIGGDLFAATGPGRGIQIGNAAPVSGLTIKTKTLNFDNGALDFVNDGGGNDIQVSNYQTAGVAVHGVRNGATFLWIRGNGPSGGSTFLLPDGGMVVAGGLSVDGGIAITNGADVAHWYANGPGQVRTDDELIVGGDFTHLGPGLGFYGTGGWPKPNVAGSRGGNAALQSLLINLDNLGLINDLTTP